MAFHLELQKSLRNRKASQISVQKKSQKENKGVLKSVPTSIAQCFAVMLKTEQNNYKKPKKVRTAVMAF